MFLSSNSRYGFLRSTIKRFLMKTSIFFRDFLLLRLILGGQFMVMLGSLTTLKESPASLSLSHRQLPQSSTHAPCYDSGRVISPLELCHGSISEKTYQTRRFCKCAFKPVPGLFIHKHVKPLKAKT